MGYRRVGQTSSKKLPLSGVFQPSCLPPALRPSPYPLIFRTSPYLIHQPAWLPSTALMGSHAFGQLSMRLVSSMGRSPPAPKKNAKKRKQITLPRALTKKGSTPSNSKMPPSFHQTIHKL